MKKRQEDIRILALWPKKANCANLTGLGTDATLLTKIDQPLNHYHFGPTKMCFLIFASLKSHMQAYMVKFEREREGLYTTGIDRTGCIFCGFGCHLDKHPNRFEKLKITHPQLYEYCMKSIEDGGLGMDSVLSFIGVNH